jgi:quercetin dioxygenase-like cupin family protein
MRLHFLIVVAICLAWARALLAADPAPANSDVKYLKLMARHADVADVIVNSVEGKPVDGRLLLKPLLRGEHMAMLELHYQPGTRAPLHVHTHESLIYVVSGQVRTRIGEDVYILGPGDVARHPAGVLHSVEALLESTVLEIKSPPPDVTRVLGTSK